MVTVERRWVTPCSRRCSLQSDQSRSSGSRTTPFLSAQAVANGASRDRDQQDATSRAMTDQTPKKSLTDFVEENQRLLSVIGVMVALTVFSGSLANKRIGSFLGIQFLTCALLCLIEVWRKAHGPQEPRLFLFRSAF